MAGNFSAIALVMPHVDRFVLGLDAQRTARSWQSITDQIFHALSHISQDLYRQAVNQLGAVATLLEWDGAIPSAGELLNELGEIRRTTKNFSKK